MAGEGIRLGRFGQKAMQPSLVALVALAFREEIGLTSDFLAGANDDDGVPGPELAAQDVRASATSSFPPPPRRVALTVVPRVRLRHPQGQSAEHGVEAQLRDPLDLRETGGELRLARVPQTLAHGRDDALSACVP